MKVKIKPSKNKTNTIVIPPSKSLAHRSIIAASLSSGTSIISNIDYSVDISTTIACMSQLGAKMNKNDSFIEIEGVNQFDIKDSTIIDCSESGSTIRFLIPIFSLCGKEIIFTGSKRLMERPQDVYLDIFKKQNLMFEYKDDGLHIKGPIKSDKYILDGSVSSQFITGLLFTLPLLDKDSYITIQEPFESKSYVDLTIDMLKKFNIYIEVIDDFNFKIKGNQKYISNNISIEGDFSQMSFFSALGLINNDVLIEGLNKNSLQGDKAFLDIVKNMNGKIIEDKVYESTLSDLKGTTIDLKDCPDLGPIVMALATQANGLTHVINAGRLRIKESDRIYAMEVELKKLGCDISSNKSEVFIKGKTLIEGGVTLEGHNDHRIVMALSILSTIANKEVIINGSEAINKSYPNFFNDLRKLGIEVIEYDI
ncbi:MAG: 3-phosphoshikimate 1-carboxyvinyltransferase [Erysipelotrichaceae bacterium]|nr:3-phosphoshikimate 1-carboxyvinyltransferase [Erysipelotrichaceae bacterium]